MESLEFGSSRDSLEDQSVPILLPRAGWCVSSVLVLGPLACEDFKALHPEREMSQKLVLNNSTKVVEKNRAKSSVSVVPPPHVVYKPWINGFVAINCSSDLTSDRPC